MIADGDPSLTAIDPRLDDVDLPCLLAAHAEALHVAIPNGAPNWQAVY